MSKKLTMLLTIFMVSIFAITGCKKEAKDAAKDVKKVTKDVKTAVKDGKKAVKDVKKVVKAVKGMNFDAKLNLNYFPEEAVVVGSIDIQKFLNIKILKPLLEQGLNQAKQMGIAVDKATFASFYMNLDSLKKADDVAVIVNGLTIPQELLTKMGAKSIKETYNGVELLLDPDKKGGYVTLGNDTLAGSLKSIKKMIDVKKGKSKSLATNGNAKIFTDILSKTGNSAFRIAFVPNKLVQDELGKLSKEGQAAMFADFINNFKAASFGIEVTENALIFHINVRSSEAGIKPVVAMMQPQLKMLTQENSPMLAMAEPMLGKEGTKILGEVVKTIKLTNSGEYLSITISTKLEYWLQAPKILGGMMMKGMK